ncbi:MAG: CxxxxCH/CxxCH domain-containing protein [Nitrospirae bacterium]|nr:CxxxxCH/CxxCH domain-containing protein [Nitrospirota bacterium]
MRKTAIHTTILFVVLLAFAAGTAHAADAPHNASNTMSCADCHSQFSAGSYSDDVCLSCHLNATGGGYSQNSAPKMLTHASANTSTKYGNWSFTCISCHNKHTQDQMYAYGPDSYLITGTITSVTDNNDGTTTFGYMNLIENIAGWSDFTKWGAKSGGNAAAGNERGLILFANTANPDVSFEILSATATSLTVWGSITTSFPGTVIPGNTFALVYGQLIKSAMVSAGSITRSVRFFQNSSTGSFAYNSAPGSPDPTPDGVCQVCHTRTSFWRYDGSLAGHYSGTNCTSCHKHEEGFKTSCDICHNSPPTTGTHASHVGTAVPLYGSTKVQSTPSSYGFGCGICHTGTHLNTSTDPRTVQVVFAGVATQDGATGAAYSAATFAVDDPGTGYTFTYSDGTCSNVYCHGNYPGSGRNATVHFNTGTAPCGSCHGASNTDYPSSHTHYLHAGALGSGYNIACTLCHKDTVGGSGPANYTISDMSRHANGFVDWKFDSNDPRVSQTSVYSVASGMAIPSDGYNPRSYGTCSNIYCHSIAQTSTGGPLTGAPGEYVTTLPWNNPAGFKTCGTCHKNGSGHNTGLPGPMDSGSHTAHLGYRFNTVNTWLAGSYKCAICHRYESQAAGSYNSCDACHTTTASYERHADGKVNVTVDAAFGNATYNDTSAAPGTPGNGYFRCSNTYCHSNGTSVATGAIPANNSAVWGSGMLSCGACHGNPPNYANGSPKKNSHSAHSGETCDSCHVATTADGTTITDKTTHVNKFYDVNPATSSGVTFTYTSATTGGSCSNISCHGGGNATWGTALTCQNCHLGIADIDDFTGFFSDNGTTSKIRGAGEWDTTGHGRPASSGNYPSGNSAANFTVANACQYCHDDTIAHKNAANPFRLRNIADAVWSMNGVCQNCHATGSAGITVDAVLKNGAKKIGSFHYGSKHNAGTNGGQFCWDCHDPHGDGNIFMVHAAVAKTSDMLTGAPTSSVTTSFMSFATGTSYAVSTTPYRGICNVCHTSTGHYTATSGDGHNADTRCTQCHAHTGDAKNQAFLPAGCDGCHGNPPVNNQTLVDFVVPSSTGSVTAGAHRTHVDTLGVGCDACHANSVGSGTTHNNGDLRVTIGLSLFNGAYVGGVYDGQTTVAYNASTPSTTVTRSGQKQCSNIYCHGSTMSPNGGTDITPVWDNAATAACGTCHGASAANSPRRGAHYRHTAAATDIGHDYPCSWCHKDPSTDASLHVNNRSEVIFSTNPTVSGGLYAGTPAMLDAYGTCTNVYCHSNVQTSPPGGPLTYKTINWATSYGGDMGCNLCHEGPANHYDEPLTGVTSGSHAKHAAYVIYCAACHANDITQDPDPATAGYACYVCHTSNGPNVTHANHAVDVNIVTKYSGTYTGTPAPGDAYGRCASTYCHSSGVSVRTASIPTTTSSAWGSGTLACSACHGNTTYPAPNNAMPDYPNGTPKENSHATHVISSGIPCQNCHAGTTANGTTIANTALHVNKRYDAQAAGSFNGKAISFAYTAATVTAAGSCSNISCHGGNSAAWGGAITCSSCHTGASDLNDYVYSNSIISLVSSGQWTTTGHGRAAASGNYPQSGNPAANFIVSAGAGDACLYCHDGAITHNTASNPFRLKWTTGPDGQNGNCQKCHKPGSSGYVSGVDGTLPSKNASVATKMEDYHWLLAPGGKHTDVRNSGRFCWDCHDPHGDMNVAMVHDAVAKRNDWNGATGFGVPTLTVATSFTTMNTWGSYVNPSGTGVCQVCHEVTSSFTGATNYNTNHNPGASCTGCHSHFGSATVNGDAFPGAESSGGVACGGCHTDLYTRMNSAANTTYHHLLTSDAPTYASGTCLQCHVDHNIFRPEVNTANTVGRSANLRTNINTAVPSQPTTVGYTNTDFLSTDTDGGICLSCHKTQLAKGYPQPDATTVTPAVGKADYQASGHQYVATSTFGTGGSTFNANCSKCHNDTMNPKSSFNAQSSANKFGNHSSTLRRILAALGIASPADPLEEQFCYQCHSGAGPNDYYGAKAMSAASRDIQTVFGKTYKHNVAGYSGQHRSSTTDETPAYISANKHVECEDCHNPHAAQPGTHTRGSAALANVLKGVDGAIASYPSNTNWPATGTPPRSNFTYAATQTSTAEYQICFKCHSYANTNVLTWGGTGAAAWTDVGLEFNPNNQSYHPVVQALPAIDPNANYGSNRLASAQLTGGWTPGQVMTCSDCHDSDSVASKGPHGSAVKWMLAGTNKSWPYQGTAGNGTSTGTLWTYNNRTTNSGTANGLFCLNCHTLNASRHVHTAKDDHQSAACVGCHIRVPHGYRESRLIAAGTVPARYYPNGNGGGTKYINTFTKAATLRDYRKNNCSTVNGCH